MPDVMASFRADVVQLLLEFGDAVLDSVRDSKGIDVEDVRSAMRAQNVSTTRPARRQGAKRSAEGS